MPLQVLNFISLVPLVSTSVRVEEDLCLQPDFFPSVEKQKILATQPLVSVPPDFPVPSIFDTPYIIRLLFSLDIGYPCA